MNKMINKLAQKTWTDDAEICFEWDWSYTQDAGMLLRGKVVRDTVDQRDAPASTETGTYSD